MVLQQKAIDAILQLPCPSCVRQLERMTDSFLKLNDDKTELLLIGNPKRVAKAHQFLLQVEGNTVNPKTCAKNLGVNFASTLSFRTFINKTASSARNHIRTLAAIRDQLPRELTSRLCTSLVINRLDHCNSVLLGVPQCILRSLKLALNMAARLVFEARRSCLFPLTTAKVNAERKTHRGKNFHPSV